MEEDYLDVNKKLWNDRLESHVESDFYDMESFLQGKLSLKDEELNLLGEIQGKSVLHLQCHFGQDSISLSRMGAEVTGIDLSDKAIEYAKRLAEECGQKTEFIQSDVYSLPEKLNKKFDVVFTSYGTIGWLPDLDKWAGIVSHFLKDGGEFVFVEFHPVVWMYDDNFKSVSYSYFNKEAIVEEYEGSYADKDSGVNSKSVGWNHSLGEVMSALLGNGIEIVHFDEKDFSPYDCFSETVKEGRDMYRIKHLSGKIPMMYSIKGIRK